MKEENCIDVKYVYNLSINYLTRFFGAAGKIIHVYKDENSKYVTIEFANNYGVDKALRFNGRVLDKEPIKIKKWKENSPNNKSSQDKIIKENEENTINNAQKQENLSMQIRVNKLECFKNEFWSIVQSEINAIQYENNQRMMISMLIWALGNQVMTDIRHLEHFKINTRSNSLYVLLENKIINVLEMISNSTKVDFKVFGVKLESASFLTLWLQMPSSNIQEEQSKIESCSLREKLLSAMKVKHNNLANIFNALYSASFCQKDEQETEHFDLLNLEFHLETNQEDHYEGIIENVGVQDVFYENEQYCLPNTCIYLLKQSPHPLIFNCSMRLVGCEGIQFQEKSWCDIYSASLCLNISQQKRSYSIINKMQVQRFSLMDHNLIFQNCQFSIQSIWKQYEKYKRFCEQKSVKVICVRKKENEEERQEERQEETLQPSPQKHEQQQLLSIILIEIRSQNIYSFNQYKLQHYLENYIDSSVIDKGLIIASKEMAIKLASNIIDREKESRLFEFANSRYEKYIGQELWRLYQIRNERKLKNNLTYYRMSKK